MAEGTKIAMRCGGNLRLFAHGLQLSSLRQQSLALGSSGVQARQGTAHALVIAPAESLLPVLSSTCGLWAGTAGPSGGEGVGQLICQAGAHPLVLRGTLLNLAGKSLIW